ncbi:hypothetical protein [Arabiibacter massiliensis]|uniref:hypothetical protein n=1 Tax=Arabiibacter massiliensis TaxID=1870985 RepID=UPI001179914B|nr:hypothetical protein [Arabiibacter massiliensis]
MEKPKESTPTDNAVPLVMSERKFKELVQAIFNERSGGFDGRRKQRSRAGFAPANGQTRPLRYLSRLDPAYRSFPPPLPLRHCNFPP